MRSAMTRPTKYQKARKAYIDRVRVEAERREAEVEAGRRDAGQTVLAAGEGGQWVELDEKEHLRDRHRDHGEIDAGAPEGDETNQITDDARDRWRRSRSTLERMESWLR